MIRFLKRLLGFSAGSAETEGDLPGMVGDPETLARFLFSDKVIARTTGRVKRHAFDPPVNLRLSVFRIDRLAEEDIWKLGRERAGAARNESPRARADLRAIDVRTTQLNVVAAPEDHPRHANIVGWPTEKERIRLLAMELATKSRLRLPTAPA